MISHFVPKQNKFNGILSYINTNSNSRFSEFISFVPSSPLFSNFQQIQDILPPSGVNRVVISQNGASFTFTFNSFSMNVTSYSIKSSNDSTRILTHWKLEACNNGLQWELVDEVDNNAEIIINRKLQHNVYNSFKLTKLNENNDDHQTEIYTFDLYGFEIFGTICNPISCDLFIPKICTSPNRPNLFSLLFISIPILQH